MNADKTNISNTTGQESNVRYYTSRGKPTGKPILLRSACYKARICGYCWEAEAKGSGISGEYQISEQWISDRPN
jgi:hypothetical protein